MKRLAASALAALGGVAQTLSQAPFDWAWLLPLGLVCWLVGLRVAPVAASFGFGLGLYASGAHWVWISIHDVAQTPFIIAALLQGAFILGLAGLFALNGWFYRRLHPLSEWIRFPGLVLISELIRSYFLTGFPWLLAGYAALDTPYQTLAPLIGVYGLSALAGIAAVALARRSWVLVPLAALAWVPSVSWTQPQDTRSFNLVQGNIPADKKWDPDWRERIIDRHLALTLDNPADIIIWSEAALPLLNQSADQFFQQLGEALPDSAIVSGRLIAGPKDRLPRYYNAMAGTGLAQGADYKSRLVPFGEYMPLERWLRGLIDFFDLPLSTIIAGQSSEPLQLDGWQPGSLICYEVAYPGLAWQVGRDSEILLSVSNDAWFGSSIARDQHLQMARMRALELGRPMLRATNDGITAHIAANGQVLAQLPNFTHAALRGEVQAVAGRTPYGWIGPWPWLAVASGLLIWALIAVPLRRRDR